MAKVRKNILGAWAFLIGVVIALLAGIFTSVSTWQWTPWVLVIAGIVIGLFNVTSGELKEFMIAGAILVVVSALGSTTLSIIGVIGNVADYLVMLFVPATIIVSLKAVFAAAGG